MPRVAPNIVLTPDERAELERLVRAHRVEKRVLLRAQVILLAAQGLQNKAIARELGVTELVVAKWRNRFAKQRLAGLTDAPGRGRPQKFTGDDKLKIIRTACSQPAVDGQWSVRTLQKHLREKCALDISAASVHRELAAIDLKPHQCQSWLESRDPEFEAKQVQIIGLYMNPPDNALVLCVDEKTAIQAVERETKPMQPGQPAKMDAHYKRHGTQSLLAALLVHEGKVVGKCYDRHTHEEFLDFMNELVCHYRDRELYVILDNLSVHKHRKVQQWLATQEGRVHFVFTPTKASWLNQVELWFSILTRKVIKRGIFNSTHELVQKIMAFIEQYNHDAKPFKWTYTGEPLRI